MIVWAVERLDDGAPYLLGLYSTEELAQAEVDDWIAVNPGIVVECYSWEVDS